MKKFFMGLMSALLAAAMCVSFAACGEDDSGSNGETPDASSGTESTTPNGGSGENEGSNEEKELTVEGILAKANEIVSDRVTAEEWEAAFAEENFKNVEFKNGYIDEAGSKGDDGWMKETMLQTYSCNGATAFVKYSYKTEGVFSDEDEGYLEHEEQFYWTIRDGYMIGVYQDEDGKWVEERDETEELIEHTYIGAYFAYKLCSDTVIDNYEAFTYSEEEKGYVLNENPKEWQEGTTFVVKFKDGKLATTIYKYENEEHIYNAFGIFTYGGQTVTLPEISE